MLMPGLLVPFVINLFCLLLNRNSSKAMEVLTDSLSENSMYANPLGCPLNLSHSNMVDGTTAMKVCFQLFCSFTIVHIAKIYLESAFIFSSMDMITGPAFSEG